jgi:hypothetical protein
VRNISCVIMHVIDRAFARSMATHIARFDVTHRASMRAMSRVCAHLFGRGANGDVSLLRLLERNLLGDGLTGERGGRGGHITLCACAKCRASRIHHARRTRFLGLRGEDQNLRRGRDVVFDVIRTPCILFTSQKFFRVVHGWFLNQTFLVGDFTNHDSSTCPKNLPDRDSISPRRTHKK